MFHSTNFPRKYPLSSLRVRLIFKSVFVFKKKMSQNYQNKKSDTRMLTPPQLAPFCTDSCLSLHFSSLHFRCVTLAKDLPSSPLSRRSLVDEKREEKEISDKNSISSSLSLYLSSPQQQPWK